MARLKCVCGSGLSNTNAPSDNILYVFTKAEVDNAINNNAEITLYDFETCINEGYEYWYCQDCKRVMVVERKPCGRLIDSYSSCSSCEAVSEQALTEFYVFSDIDIYNAEEEDINLLLSVFIHQYGEEHLRFITADKKNVFKKSQDNNLKLIYTKE